MRRSATRSSVAALVLALLGVLCWQAGPFLARHARASYATAGLDVERAGWDTLRTRLRFVRRTSLGRAQAVAPSATRVSVFTAGYDTLYSGPAARPFPLPDRRLASREPLLVEACGALRPAPARPARSDAARVLCEQRTIFASPKRVRAEDSDVAFAPDGTFERGRYDVHFVAERRAFRDRATWERLGGEETPSGYLLARSESGGGTATVRVPMSASGHGDFDLSRYDGYRDFQYHLRAALEQVEAPGAGEKAPTAPVDFEVLAGLNGAPPQPVSRQHREVRRLTPDERRRRVQGFARSAAEALARRLGAGRSDGASRPEAGREEETDGVRVTVHGWSYDRLKGRYEADLRVRWYEAGGFRDERYTLEGTLTVNDESRRARFVGQRGNGRAVRRWRRVVEGDALPLGVLEAPADGEALPDVEEAPLRGLADGRAPRRDRSRRNRSRRRGDRRQYWRQH